MVRRRRGDDRPNPNPVAEPPAPTVSKAIARSKMRAMGNLSRDEVHSPISPSLSPSSPSPALALTVALALALAAMSSIHLDENQSAPSLDPNPRPPWPLPKPYLWPWSVA